MLINEKNKWAIMSVESTNSPSSAAGEQVAPQFELNATRQFVPWLVAQKISISGCFSLLDLRRINRAFKLHQFRHPQ
jgi:hypothetical protein